MSAEDAAHRYVIAYDIVEDDRRTKVAKALEDYGVRVQYSVFECELVDAQLADLSDALERQMDRATDTVSIYPLCKRCEAGVKHMGCEPPDPNPPFVLL